MVPRSMCFSVCLSTYYIYFGIVSEFVCSRCDHFNNVRFSVVRFIFDHLLFQARFSLLMKQCSIRTNSIKCNKFVFSLRFVLLSLFSSQQLYDPCMRLITEIVYDNFLLFHQSHATICHITLNRSIL